MSGGTPIKFGPEWLRNIGRTGDSTRPNNQNGSGPSEATGSGNQNSIAAGSSRAPTSTGLPTTSSVTGAVPSAVQVASGALGTSAVRQTNTPRVFLANLRYGREEMLALYDRGAAGAPEQLKYFDSLYQPRGKPPSALNAFEDEQNVQHEGLRGGVPITAGAPSGFGRGRGAVANFGRRGAFVKTQTASRGWSRARMPGLTSGSTEEEPPSLRPWSTSNGAGPSRSTPVESSEWTQTKLFRNRRHVHNTNWRQSGRDEGDEWRMQEHGNRSGNPERDWPERPAQDRPQSWGSNRRPWADNQTSDDIPEWANDNAEAGAGTFDASGAFHGYSNDDSNIPRQQETPFPLARSYTHAAFTRSKTVEEGSDEWWASEKAKKLAPKRLLGNEYNKYEKTSSSESNEPNTSRSMSFDDHQEMPEMLKLKHLGSQNKSTNDAKNQYTESKTFDALMRSDIEIEEAKDDRSNFQSVMIASNNSLRQKHQNIVASTADAIRRTPHNSVNINMPYGVQHNSNKSENAPTQPPDEKIAEDMFEMTLDDTNLPALNRTSNMPHGAPGGMCILQSMSTNNPVVQIGMPIPGLQNQPMGINATSHQVQSNIQNVGMQNSALNSSLGLPIGAPNNGVMLLQGVLPQVMANTPMNPAMNAALQQHSNVMGAFQQNLPVIPSPNIANQSLYMAQNNNQQLPLPNGHPQNPEVQNNIFPMHGTRQAQLTSIYRGVSIPTQNTSNAASLSELWFYEDPEKNIQGPFSSKEMWNWYGAGFFSPSLMVRRACETSMRPLASYGPMPFAQMDMFPLQVNQQQQQSTLGIADSLWSQPSTSREGMWMQSSINRPESRVNNLPLYFWDTQPSAISSNTMLPEEIIKEMKTEDEILAQIRAPQNIPVSRISFSDDAVTSTTLGVTNSGHSFVEAPPVPDLTALQKIMQPEAPQNPSPSVTEVKAERELTEEIADKIQMPVETEPNNAKVPQPPIKVESKVQKTTKNETDKAVKNKDNNGNKIKAKKTKDDKKDETSVNTDEELTKKRSVESSPSKSFKDIKPPNKKEIEKEKKELTKDGFTIVKGAEKNNKENKKKADEAKATDEAERKRKEEEKREVVEDKKKTSLVATKKQQEQQQQKQVSDSVPKKAPWSAVATQAIATNKDGLTLTEIQKLEREKKLEQMKEQQQMMHIIAQQQAAALAREQEMQAGLGWAKKMNANASSASSQTLAEIQSETRRHAAAATAAAAAAQALEEAQAAPAVAVTHVPWGNSSIGGFWDCPNQLPKADPVKMEPTKPVEVKKSKFKAPAPMLPPLSSIKKETTPAMEFETWCCQALGFWSSKIDVPTFVGFLKDIESPYEVKDYVKCYLGESKDSSDFSRQFLERRSKLLRVGMVTPSDDLCSPALAINPRNTSMSDYQEVKGKGKKTKKNKMMKVDARILGFSVTAAEDRINVGDIDTA